MGDGGSFDDVVGQHFVGAGGRREAPLIALGVVRPVFGIEMRRRGSDVSGDGRCVDLGFGEGHREGALVIHRHLCDVFAVVLLGVWIDDVVRDPQIGVDEKIPGLDGHAVRVAGFWIEAEIGRAAVCGNRPFVCQAGDHLHGFRVKGHQREVDVIV